MYQLLYVESTLLTYYLVTFALLAIVIITTIIDNIINTIIIYDISREYISCWKIEAADFFNGAAAAGQMLLSFCLSASPLLHLTASLSFSSFSSLFSPLFLSNLPLFTLPTFQTSCIN